jgi:hypothetical protein
MPAPWRCGRQDTSDAQQTVLLSLAAHSCLSCMSTVSAGDTFGKALSPWYCPFYDADRLPPENESEDLLPFFHFHGRGPVRHRDSIFHREQHHVNVVEQFPFPLRGNRT